MKLIKLENVNFSYTSEPFLENIHLKISKQDKCIFLHGKNGSGKSTLLNLLCGILKPTNGTLKRKEMSIAFLPYESILFKNLDVLDNLKYYYRNFCNQNFSLSNPKVNRLLSLLKIDFFDRKIANCSSGEQKKIALACVLFMEADLIILDEPFVAIDYQSLDTIIQLINTYKQNSIFLITTHSFSIMEKIVDRLLILEDGKITLDSSDLEVIKSYRKHDERIT